MGLKYFEFKRWMDGNIKEDIFIWDLNKINRRDIDRIKIDRER